MVIYRQFTIDNKVHFGWPMTLSAGSLLLLYMYVRLEVRVKTNGLMAEKSP